MFAINTATGILPGSCPTRARRKTTLASPTWAGRKTAWFLSLHHKEATDLRDPASRLHVKEAKLQKRTGALDAQSHLII
jgi:hypothetical protein